MIVGLVLAGGLSSRMGQDKAMLQVDGRTLLERTVVAVRRAGAQRVAISGDRAGGMPDRWHAAGPLGGIASAMAELPDGEWLVVPVDMPRLGDEVLVPLLDARDTAATCWQDHPLPMRLTMNPRTRDALDHLMSLADRERSVAALQVRLGTTTLSLDGIDTRWLVNCNTPDDWREANA